MATFPCPHCGDELPDEARFCGSCGRAVSDGTPAAVGPVDDDRSTSPVEPPPPPPGPDLNAGPADRTNDVTRQAPPGVAAADGGTGRGRRAAAIGGGAILLAAILGVGWLVVGPRLGGGGVTEQKLSIPLEEPSSVWDERTDGIVESATVVDGVLVTAATDHESGDVILTGWELATGQDLWDIAFDDVGSMNMAAGDGIVVAAGAIFEDERAQVMGLDAGTGEERWNETLRGVGVGIVHVEDGSALVRTSDVAGRTDLISLSLADGSEQWDESADQFLGGSGERLVIRDGDDVVVLSTSSGEEIWSQDVFREDEFASGEVVDEIVVLTQGEDTVAFDADGTELWDLDDYQVRSSVPGVGIVLQEFNGDEARMVDARTGAEIWDDDDPGYQVERTTDGAHIAIAEEFDGETTELRATDLLTGDRLAREEIDGSQAVSLDRVGRLDQIDVRDLVLVADGYELSARGILDLDDIWSVDAEGDWVQGWLSHDGWLVVSSYDAPDSGPATGRIQAFR